MNVFDVYIFFLKVNMASDLSHISYTPTFTVDIPFILLSQSQCVDLVDFLGKVHLLLLVDDAQPCFGHQAVHDVQVPAHAAVHLVGHHALIRHVVLDHHQAVGPQGAPAALQKAHQVLVRQVTWEQEGDFLQPAPGRVFHLPLSPDCSGDR